MLTLRTVSELLWDSCSSSLSGNQIALEYNFCLSNYRIASLLNPYWGLVAGKEYKDKLFPKGARESPKLNFWQGFASISFIAGFLLGWWGGVLRKNWGVTSSQWLGPCDLTAVGLNFVLDGRTKMLQATQCWPPPHQKLELEKSYGSIFLLTQSWFKRKRLDLGCGYWNTMGQVSWWYFHRNNRVLKAM